MAYTTIKKPSDYFNTVTWTGDGVNGRTITTGHDTNFIWGKERSNANSNWLIDIIRGAGQRLRSDTTNAQDSLGSYPSFVTNGFTVPSTLSLNGSGRTFVGWSWLADNTSGSSNTDGSITSTVSANTTSGFSIVSYTGTGATATVGHGLGTPPAMIIVKNRDTASEWRIYHSSRGAQYGLKFTTDAEQNIAGFWNDTEPTSSVFTIGDHSTVNTNTDDYIAYCFAEKKGFSKFGSYTGNGSTDGTFAYTGFKPAFVLLKNADDGTRSWYIFDNKRNTFNATNSWLAPNLSNAEGTVTSGVDFLSNGFKVRESTTAFNGSGNTFIYMAFAEEPLVGDNPATAR